MSKTKKVLLMCATYVLVIALAIGGTLAYLTDRDSKVNTFTVGDVEIELTEKFEQGAELLPGVRVEKEVAIKNTGKNDAWVWYTYAVPTALVDSGNDSYKNAVHFDMRISTWDRYRTWESYWLEGQTEAVPLEKTWQYKDTVHNIKTVVDGVDYTISTFLYNGTLAPNTTTTVSLEKVYLDKCVDIDPEGNWYWVEDGNVTDLNWNTEENGAPMIYVSAYAIQADGITDVNSDSKIDVNDAYAAYNKQWGENGAEYADPDATDKEVVLDIDETAKTVKIDSADELFLFAKSLNEGTKNFSGYTVTLEADIDLKNKPWTPIGQTGHPEFRGTFDGNNHTIKNLFVDNSAYTDEHTSTGLFGWAESGVTIKNVKIDGATVKGNHNVAVIVGYTYSGKISNCHVSNATVICTHANGDACGDKAGTIAGYTADESRLTDCTASNSTVTAGRDAGQLFGLGYNKSVSNCTATDVTVSAGGDCTGANIRNEVIGRVG